MGWRLSWFMVGAGDSLCIKHGPPSTYGSRGCDCGATLCAGRVGCPDTYCRAQGGRAVVTQVICAPTPPCPQVLMDSLCGSSKVLLVCNVSPEASSAQVRLLLLPLLPLRRGCCHCCRCATAAPAAAAAAAAEWQSACGV